MIKFEGTCWHQCSINIIDYEVKKKTKPIYEQTYTRSFITAFKNNSQKAENSMHI